MTNREIKTSAYRPIGFTVHADPGSDVRVCGSFNSWDTENHKMSDWDGHGEYHIFLRLPRGEHEYKYIINGTWQTNPRCNQQNNRFGSSNNVVQVD